MAQRKGLGISVKMILTTTVLIGLIVLGFGWLQNRNLEDAYDRTARERIETFRESLDARGVLTTQVFAEALEPHLINNADAEVASLVRALVKQDKDLSLVYVVARNQRLVTYCKVAAPGSERTCDLGGHPPEMHVAPNHPSWARIVEEWQRRAGANQTDPRVALELPAGGGDGAMKVFATLIYVNVDPTTGAEPTAAAAAATDADAHRQGYVVLGYDLAPIARFAAESEQLKKDASKKARFRTAAVGLLFVLVGALLAIFQGLQIAKPIKQLAWRADQIARGDLASRVDVRSTDEIGVLGQNFNFMADQISVLLTQAADKATLEKELEVARTIQETLVPTHEPVDKDSFKFAGYFQPASTCGGDWWTWHDLKDGKVLVVIGDVTGHGVPSAMITAAAKAACDVARRVADDDVDPARLLEIMNSAIYQSAKRKFVMTCFASVVDTRKRTITYANAGHNFPYLYRATDGGGEFGSLMIRGNRLGDLADSLYETKTTDLQPGDLLVWYTDGIVECESSTGEEYGEKRFRASVRRAAALDAAEIRDAVVTDAATFFGDTVRKDDITLVLGKIH